MGVTVKPLAECGVLILGGTSGVGLATAIRFLTEGSRVVILGRDAKRGAAALATCRERVPSASVDFLPVDGNDAAAVVRAEEDSRSRLGAIDVLVGSSGLADLPRLLHEIPIEAMRTRIGDLLMPPLHFAHAVLPAMRRQGGGSIVLIASDAAKVATPGETLIGAAMAAMVQFTRTVAIEAKREGVRINVLTPSLIANTLGADLVLADGFAGNLFRKAIARAHLGIAEPEDLVGLIVFLASPAGRRITGQAISVNGGISAA